ncbi:MAG: tRNA dimethylallyltransferase [Candidatus Anoxychlamydiales bacterium]|nr:tRNA dimethylallyltransferase [Candidatus Anoxychlamydiales bacterium]NGX41153.1 tRNA dimethylallyltransferase [Candidatus Anoxychlamydiales bacterium]HEU64861.1 tRNA (adenosine(37)-N6)-dimethylallyltransferase MiaA [Chlamydiota bacterium]
MSIFYNTEDIQDQVSELYLPLRKKNQNEISKKKVIVIAGPTAVGKTALSISIAEILGGEIISADSMQVYKGMDIGTAKANKDEQKNVIHHLLDIKDIHESFNVSEFYRAAHRACRQILFKGKVPIVVGGSGFYIHAFLYGPPLGPPSNQEIRKKIEEQLEKLGAEELYERVQMLDPEYAKTITHRDKHKIVRALEIMSITKKKVSDIPKPDVNQKPLYNYRLWFLYYPKEDIYKLVDKRCDQMIENGFIDEVEKLAEKGLESNYSASQAIGYRQCLKYLNSNKTLDDRITFIDEFKKASKKYVKRQFTWFKKESNFRSLNLKEISIEKAKEYILQDYEQSM